MTKKEISTHIKQKASSFLKEKDLDKFSNNLLRNFKESDLRQLIQSEIEKIKDHLRKKHTANMNGHFTKPKNNSRKVINERCIAGKKIKQIEDVEALGILIKKIETGNVPITYAELENLLVRKHIIRNLIRSNYKGNSYNSESNITVQDWHLIKRYLQNLLVQQASNIKKAKIHLDLIRERVYTPPSPLTVFASRNIYKMISIAKRN